MDKTVDAAVPAEDATDFGTSYEGISRRWNAELKQARKERDPFDKKAKKILKRYRLEQGTPESDYSSKRHRFNILWSNLEILQPATYSKRPKALIKRRHLDSDPVALCASMILERATNYEIEHYNDLHEATKAANRDRLLPGIGAQWIRFEPVMGEMSITDDVTGKSSTVEEVKSAKSCIDYVNWADYLESPARTAEERRWIARRVPMTRKKVLARFKKSMAATGAEMKSLPFRKPKKSDDDKEQPDQFFEVADVWEIWDKEERKVIFQVADYKFPLEVRDDPLKLENFWPAPEPLLATVAGDNRIPTADYCYYEDHAAQLDDITRRINLIQQSIRVAGLYDKSNDGLKQLLDAAYQNTMIPVDGWQGLMDRGGLENAISWFPIDLFLKNLQSLYQAQNNVKATIFEITGIADIVRGATVASETLGAQELKAKFANLRIQSRQETVTNFVSQTIAIKCEIMARHYPPEVLMRRAATAQLPPDLQQLVPQALQLLRDEEEFAYRVDVASDSMVELDYDNEKTARVEMLNAVSQFMPQALQMVKEAPQSASLVAALLGFGIRGFRIGREVELEFERFSQQMKTTAANPPQPPPDASLERVKVEAQRAADDKAFHDGTLALQDKEINLKYSSQDTQSDTLKAQQDMQLLAEKHSMEMQKGEQDMQLAREKHAMELEKSQMDMKKAEFETGAKVQMDGERHQSDMASASQQRQLAEVQASREGAAADAEATQGADESNATVAALTQATEALTKVAEAIQPVDMQPVADAIASLKPALESLAADKELVEDPQTGSIRSRRVPLQ